MTLAGALFSRRSDRLIAFALSLVGHGVAWALSWFLQESPDIPHDWTYQLPYLLVLMAILSLMAGITDNTVAIPVILGVRLILMVIVGMPLGRYLAVELVLMTTLLLEAGFYLDFPGNLAAAAVVMLAALLSQLPVKAWNQWTVQPTSTISSRSRTMEPGFRRPACWRDAPSTRSTC